MNLKRLLVVAVSFLMLVLLASSAAVSQEPATQRKVKAKGGKVVNRDKSKPVRKALEEWYAKNIAAFNAKDVNAIMALRTEDFHTQTPDGKTNSRADMEARTKVFLERIDHFISQHFELGVIEVNGELASAEVKQDTVRMQRLPDGTLHKVQALAVQQETWKQTSKGWKLYRVDNVRSLGTFVDDKPYQPKQ